MNVAANYLASFQPVRPVLDGFGLALSTQATDRLAAIPEQNAAMEVALGQRALAELGANRRQQMSLDAQQAQLDDDRQRAALRMAGEIFGMGGGVSPGLQVSDPLQLKAAWDATMRQRQADLASRSLRGNAYLSQALENLQSVSS